MVRISYSVLDGCLTRNTPSCISLPVSCLNSYCCVLTVSLYIRWNLAEWYKTAIGHTRTVVVAEGSTFL